MWAKSFCRPCSGHAKRIHDTGASLCLFSLAVAVNGDRKTTIGSCMAWQAKEGSITIESCIYVCAYMRKATVSPDAPLAWHAEEGNITIESCIYLCAHIWRAN